MFPTEEPAGCTSTCLPHRRGDVSQRRKQLSCLAESSPQAWGCFHLTRAPRGDDSVFPTGVGMFPNTYRENQIQKGLPHRRGDVSTLYDNVSETASSSPQAWGCFFLLYVLLTNLMVFPTGVGMFLSRRPGIGADWCLPHRRGDVSLQPAAKVFESAFSPRMWGCF